MSGGPQLPTRLLAVLAALAFVVRLPGLITGGPFSSDETSLATGGRALVEGGDLYVDVIDRKPPLPFAAFGYLGGSDVGAGLVAMRFLVAVLILATAVVVAREAQRRFGARAAWVAGIVVVAGSAALGPTDAQAANFELFAILPIAVAFVAAARGQAVTAGAALAVAVLCKQPAAVTVVPVAACLWRAGRWRSLVVAGAAGLVAVVALAAPFGIADVVRWALLGTGGYLSLGPGDLAFTGVRAAASLGLLAVFWGGVWLLALAPRPVAATDGPPVAHDRLRLRPGLSGHPIPTHPDQDSDTETVDPDVVGWTRAGAEGLSADRRGGVDPADLADRTEAATDSAQIAAAAASGTHRDLWWFLAASAVGVVAGFRFFPHYLIQLLPALALLAGRGAVRRPARVRPALAWLAVSTALAVVMAVVTSARIEPSWERPVVRAIVDNSCGDDRVLVWGNVPELYWRAERLPAGGFTHSEFVTGYSGGRRHQAASDQNVPDRQLYDDWTERVREQEPPVIVDTAAADLRGGRYFPMRRFEALQRLVDDNYDQVAEIERIRVYVRRPSSEGVPVGSGAGRATDPATVPPAGCGAPT